MKFVKNDLIRKELLEVLSNEMGRKDWLDRGLHVTDMIYCLTKAAYKRKNGAKNTEKEILLFAGGLGLEEAMLKGEVKTAVGVLEGLSYSVDRIDGFSGVPLEFKSTRVSPKKLEEFGFKEGWQKQILSYMKGTGYREFILAVYHIFGPDLQTFEVTATDVEVEENWAWIMERKRVYEWYQERGLMPTPFRYAEAWECASCAWKIVCEARALTEKEERPE